MVSLRDDCDSVAFSIFIVIRQRKKNLSLLALTFTPQLIHGAITSDRTAVRLSVCDEVYCGAQGGC